MDLTTIATIIGIMVGIIAIYEFIRRQPWKRKPDQGETLLQIDTKLGRIAEYLDGLPTAEPEIKDPFTEGMAHKEQYKYDDAITSFRQALGEGPTGSQKAALLCLIGNCFYAQAEFKQAEG
ncbi:MAG: tetratricopeptide repeat protein, partial [Chloroflexota bacterium]|nr:tetratricopeptide repeat protein [Chloroflexota bacterium]